MSKNKKTGRFPKKIAVIDVETTGLRLDDRIVSFAMMQLFGTDLDEGRLDIRGTHLVFNPMRKSQKRAREVHGFDEACLKHQEPFSHYADQIWGALDESDLVVAHNCAFDMRFIQYEMALLGMPGVKTRTHCTMTEYRKRHGSPANLDHVCCALGMPMRSTEHSAYEDAYRCLVAYLWMNGINISKGNFEDARPQNLSVELAQIPNSTPISEKLSKKPKNEKREPEEFHYISKPVPPMKPPSLMDQLIRWLSKF